MAHKRNTSPATTARIKKADKHAITAYSVIRAMHLAGASLDEMSTELVDHGIKSPRGNFRWDRVQVSRIIKRVTDRDLCP